MFKCVIQFLNNPLVKRNKPQNPSEKMEILVSLEPLEKMSFKVEKQLYEILRPRKKSFKLKHVLKSSGRLKNVFRLKDQLL